MFITMGQAEVLQYRLSSFWCSTARIVPTHLFIMMSSSSHTRSCTTVSAVPSCDASKLSSPSRLASVTRVVAEGGRDK